MSEGTKGSGGGGGQQGFEAPGQRVFLVAGSDEDPDDACSCMKVVEFLGLDRSPRPEMPESVSLDSHL